MLNHLYKIGILLFAMQLFACSNEYQEDKNNTKDLLVEGRVWHVGFFSLWPEYGKITSYTTITIGKEFSFNGKTYRKLISKTQYSEDRIEVRNLFPMREEEGRIYKLDTLSGIESLDFDCNIQVGEKDPQGNVVSEIIEKEIFPNIKRKCFIFNYQEFDTDIREYIEGIGYLNGAFLHDPTWAGAGVVLICCHNADGTFLYLNPKYECPERHSDYRMAR